MRKLHCSLELLQQDTKSHSNHKNIFHKGSLGFTLIHAEGTWSLTSWSSQQLCREHFLHFQDVSVHIQRSGPVVQAQNSVLEEVPRHRFFSISF